MSRDSHREPWPAIVASVLETTADATRRALVEVAASGLVEIRADRLRAEEVRDLLGEAGSPTIVTVRRPEDGGCFVGSEPDRRRILVEALRCGARYVDVEWRGALEDLATGEARDRVILSSHGLTCTREALEKAYGEMASVAPDAVLKIVPTARSLAEAPAIEKLLHLARSDGRRLIAFAAGSAGTVTRILGPSWGSAASYGSAGPGRQTAPGQVPASDLADVYRVLEIGEGTRRFALIGQGVSGSPSPAMHRAGYSRHGLDACYLPIEVDEAEEFLAHAGSEGPFGIEAFAVTIPFKETVARRVRLADPIARDGRAVNTVVRRGDAWLGYNTDGRAAVARTRRHIDPRGRRVAVAGAGGTARAIAAAFRRAGADVALFNRDPDRGARAAADIGITAHELSELPSASWDVLVNATPLGRGGEMPIPAGSLSGSVVVDAVYVHPRTSLCSAAQDRGLATVDGLELLAAQATRQFARMTGRRVTLDELLRAGGEWLARGG